LNNQDIIDFIFQHIDTENFLHPVAKKILNIITNRIEQEKSIKESDLYDEDWTAKERALLAKTFGDVQMLEGKPKDMLMNLALDCIEKIVLHQIDKEINEIRIKMKNAPQTGDDILELMHDIQNRQQQKKLISAELRKMSENSNQD
jgi:hypothetical protein